MAILAVNAGSSSLKFSVHPRQGRTVLPAVLSGNIQGLEPGGQPAMGWRFQGADGQRRVETGAGDDVFALALRDLQQLLGMLQGLPAIEAVAHRVVHGGERFRASVVVDEAVLEQLAALNSLAPLHQPHNLAGIRALRRAFAGLPQVACFDTAFHAGMPEVASAFALPRELTAQGVRRYGFHGLSYQYVMSRLLALSERARGRVLMAHLGNGASLCAALEGRSQATTMGFSALDGLMMGTRCGTLDAGVVLYLLEQGWDHDRLQNLLYKRSGLLGVSGVSADMRRLRAEPGDAARRAIAQFTYRVVREAGALSACIGGLDVLAFSGGIGEHDATLRADVAEGLVYLGVAIDPERNRQATGEALSPIHAPHSRVEVWVIPTDEGQVAAREAAALLQEAGA
ncbi:MAG: acetate/propionate family kinase [Rhodoferax sp.]|nr:acetate/propionate family kinase [Rhodoferax sp.]